MSVSAGAAFVDRAYMQSYFGVNAQQARFGHRPEYDAGGGLKNLYLASGWNVELTHKYSLNSGISVRWLGATPAASPLTDSRRSVAVYTTLTYSY